MVRKNLVKKQKFVARLSQNLPQYKTIVIFSFFKVNVTLLNELRRLLKTRAIKMQVIKNRLFLRALSAPHKKLADYLVKQSAFAFDTAEDSAAAKIIFGFAQKNHLKALVLKGALYQNHILSQQEIEEIAKLPTKNELVSMLANRLSYPLQALMAVITACAQKRNNS